MALAVAGCRVSAVPEFDAAFDELVDAVLQLVVPYKDGPINVIGIVTRGETLAVRLRERLTTSGYDVRGGSVDVTLYRDDLSEIGPAAVVRATDMPDDVTGVPMLLIDDVLFTGRSVRAALNVIADYGRPQFVKLAVLVDRDGRELPVQADATGTKLETSGRVNVRMTETDGHDAIEVTP